MINKILRAIIPTIDQHLEDLAEGKHGGKKAAVAVALVVIALSMAREYLAR